MRKFVSIVSLVCAVLLMASCTENEDIDLSGFQQESFDKWMAKYYPEAEKQESGIYIQWIERSGSEKKLLEGYWMKLNYTGLTGQRNYYISRSADIAHQLGYFSDMTNYVPEYLQYSPANMIYNSTAPLGQVVGLQMMEEGDSLRVFMPNGAGYTYGFTAPQSTSSVTIGNVYSPEGFSVAATTTLILDMRLQEIIRDPLQYDRDQVERYAMDSLDITDLRDSIALGVYLKKLEENPTGDTIGMDSVIRVYYTGRFMDGFIFDTNVDSIASKLGRTVSIPDSTSLNAKSWTNGINQAILNMQEGERARVVMVSGQAYGAEGGYGQQYGYTPLTTPSTYIPPYTPLIFDIYVPVRGVDAEDEDE